MNDTPDHEADFVIVGGGSAGCVLAARLSEDPGCRVLLLEAGGGGTGMLIDTPAALALTVPTSLHNWAFQTVPQPGLGGRCGYLPRGKALGGSSAINAMVYMRGHRSDYDGWASAGNPGWAFDEVLPYFRRAEHNEQFDDEFHGQGGPLNVARQRTDNPFHQHFLDAAREAGFALNPDFNGAEQDGMGLYQVTQKGGQRCSTYRAYLAPAMKRPNLQVLTGAAAQRVLFDGRRAVGVQVQHGGRLLQVRARAEVLLCAGTFQSPQLLMVSGVGRPADLQPHGVPVWHALPGVGRNLHDHIDFVFGWQTRGTDLLGVSLPGGLRLLKEVQRWRHQRRGQLASNFAEMGGFFRRGPQSIAPEFQIMVVTALLDDHARQLRWGHGLSCHLVLLHPKSRGTVSLDGPTMQTAPRIDPQFFADPRDLEDMVLGFRRARHLMTQPSLARHTVKDLFTAGVVTDDHIRAVLRQRSDTVYHPVGTCRMGPRDDEHAVVDHELRVHGLQGLRVVDASVMPTIPGGNTNAPTVMVAEKAADLIRGRAPARSATATTDPDPAQRTVHRPLAPAHKVPLAPSLHP